jgi:hypothetical protein
MIPKTIHYCWFGGKPLSGLAKKCIRSWKKHCPTYDIRQWNESNFDLGTAPLYVRQAYEAGKWAFVSDYVRLQIVYEQGGIYMDTDVELLRSLDGFLEDRAYFGFESEAFVNTGHGFGAEKGTPILREMMDVYRDLSYLLPDGSVDQTPCPERNTAVLVANGLIPNGSEQMLPGGIHIYPKDVFCPKDPVTREMFRTERTVSVHHFNASWHTSFQSYLYRKERQYIKKYGQHLAPVQMELWHRRNRVLVVLMTEGPKACLEKTGKKLRDILRKQTSSAAESSSENAGEGSETADDTDGDCRQQ